VNSVLAATGAPSIGILAAALATRTLVVAVVAIGGLRLFGKRELGQLTILDLAMVMALSNAVQNAMTQGSGYLAGGLASAGSLVALGGVAAFAFRRSPALKGRVVGSPTLLVFDGSVIKARLRAEGVTLDQVMTAVREHGLSSLDDVFSATLEVDGTISVIARSAQRRSHRDALRFRSGRIPRP